MKCINQILIVADDVIMMSYLSGY